MVGEGRGTTYQDITGTVGNTPIVKISEKLFSKPGVELWAKCEYFNPLSSVKDRLALAIIQDAEARGELKPGDTVVEATSGNTGIAVAMVCAQRGYKCVICMAEPFSVERRKLMRMLGAKVIVTPKAGKGTGMVRKAEELCAKHGWFLCHQFENEANWKFHELTTGPEILNDLPSITHWVTGYGTGGTFHGAGKALKAAKPDLKIVLAEPEAAGLLASGIPTERKADGSPAGSHPAFAAHPIQGWTPDFIPKVLEDAPMSSLIGDAGVFPIPGGEAIATAKALASQEGLLTGISGGGTMYAALETAKSAPEGSVILAMLPDTGERYLSTPLFADIAADMNDEELDIAKSTPSFQLIPDQEPVLQVD
jgi:cysteine synthase